MHLLRTACGVISCLLISSCGWLKGDDSDDQGGTVTTPTRSIFPPADYTLDDAECQSRQDTVSLTRTGIQRWAGLQVTGDLTELAETRTLAQGSVVNNVVYESRFRREFVRSCDPALYERFGCVDTKTKLPVGWMVTNGQGGKLRVCKDNYTYDRQSYEGVALTSLYHLQSARRAYVAATGNDNLPKTILEVLPIVKDVLKDYQKTPNAPKEDAIFYHTHNAAYARSAKDDYIFIFPETKDLGYQPRGFLWESAFVLSHEYGHLVENKLWGERLEALGLLWDPFLHQYRSLTIDSRARSRRVSGSSNPQVFGSFSEGFADLIGLYSLKGNIESLVGIECLGYNRNPVNDTFHDGTTKVLTADVVSTLLEKHSGSAARGAAEQIAACEVPNFTDIHAVGAILAYYINEILTAVTAWTADGTTTPAADTTEQEYKARYLLILATADQLTKDAASKVLPDANQFDLVTGALEKVILEHIAHNAPTTTETTSRAELMQKLCILSRQIVPAVTVIPFSEGGEQCATISP